MTLGDFFETNPSVALAFSGGVDSAYLLYAAKQAGARVKAYFVSTVFQPGFEFEDAQRLVAELGAEFEVIGADPLGNPDIAKNSKDRCYHCKKCIFHAIADKSETDGLELIVDGSNASDDEGDRPGMRAIRELGVRSPLRECGLTKDEIRRLSREAGLFTWNKPAYACLATRIPVGTRITRGDLEKIEKAESFLGSLGLTDFRARLYGGGVRLEVPGSQMERVIAERKRIEEYLYGIFDPVVLDLKEREASV